MGLVIQTLLSHARTFSLAAALLLTACQNDGANQSASQKAEPVEPMALVLAMSWQPAFCEKFSRKRECRSQNAGRYDATHFALHGLWPQPRGREYCGVSDRDRETDKRRRWRDLPDVALSAGLRDRLDTVMPGVQSYLDRHEWIKHGTCYSSDMETYYRDSLGLMDAINASSVRDLFARSIGRRLDAFRIRQAFDDAFGRGVGRRVRVSCRDDGNRRLIGEITLGLEGVVGETPDIGKLALASRTLRGGCPGGIVDPVGLQ